MIKHHNKRFKLKMSDKFEKEGVILKENTFETQKGTYRIAIIFSEGMTYFAKYKDGRLVEAINIGILCKNKKCAMEETT